jgi:hypothetical protein
VGPRDLGLLLGKRRLSLRRLVGERVHPLHSELSEGLALHNLGGIEGDLEWLELHSTLCHLPGDIGVP